VKEKIFGGARFLTRGAGISIQKQAVGGSRMQE
jgi:hypothetical protein